MKLGVVLLVMFCSQIATAGEMLVNLGPDATRADDVEPYAAGIAADTQATRLGINSAGTLGQTNFDDQQVTITFSPGWAGIKMAAFSDDGVTVTISDVTSSTTGSSTVVMTNKGTGQALPNLSQSLKDIDFTFLPHHTYEITVDYLNTYYTGDGDVDGAQLIAYGQEGDGYENNPGGATNSVEFKNTSRGGDRVVSAKDEAQGLPGGTKTLEVKVKPATATATLKIKSNGGGGTAVFASTETDTCTVTGTETITILGRNMSTAARDVSIEASVNEVVMATWDFTVFQVGISAYASGTIDDIPGFQFASSDTGGKLGTIFDHELINSHRLGHVVRPQPPYNPKGTVKPTAYGGIVLKGQVVPSGVKKADFNNAHSRSSSFDWKRVIDSVQFNQNGNLMSDSFDIDFVPWRNMPDDKDDDDEDLTADRDGTANELLLWSVDCPTISQSDLEHQGRIVRERFNALEWVNYAGVQVSPKWKWTWRASMENPNDSPQRVIEFVQNNDIPGDNVLAVGQWSALSPDLQPVGANPMTITGFTPVEFDRIDPPVGPEQVTFTVTGTGFPITPNPKPIVLLFLHTDNDTTTSSSFMSPFVLAVTPTEIRGTLAIAKEKPNGSYSVNVFAGPHWSVANSNFLLK